jgi:hypothetical protein
VHPEADAWPSARDVDLDLVPDLLVEPFAVAGEGELNEGEVFAALASEGGCTQRSR